MFPAGLVPESSGIGLGRQLDRSALRGESAAAGWSEVRPEAVRRSHQLPPATVRTVGIWLKKPRGVLVLVQGNSRSCFKMLVIHRSVVTAFRSNRFEADREEPVSFFRLHKRCRVQMKPWMFCNCASDSGCKCQALVQLSSSIQKQAEYTAYPLPLILSSYHTCR